MNSIVFYQNKTQKFQYELNSQKQSQNPFFKSLIIPPYLIIYRFPHLSHIIPSKIYIFYFLHKFNRLKAFRHSRHNLPLFLHQNPFLPPEMKLFPLAGALPSKINRVLFCLEISASPYNNIINK